VELVALTKADLLDDKALQKVATAIEKLGGARPFPVSAPLEQGLDPLLDAIIERLATVADTKEEFASERPWSPL